MGVPSESHARAREGVRPEIQALRALAVTLVVVAHLWPGSVPAGFAGVDVFFAVSGFLITGQLLRELERTGRIDAARFWARRARRLLPAALIVLLACAAATLLVVPQAYRPGFLGDIAASTAYVQNWHLAHAAVDYHAQSDAVSPAQHFWSLSAEEQFYLVWPLLFLGAAAVARRRRRPVRPATLGALLGAVTLASFAYAAHASVAEPASAYFVTPARAWEFGLGGLLALLLTRRHVPAAWCAGLSWAGLAAILAGAWVFGASSPWPSWPTILPVAGALAVIAAGLPAERWGPRAVLAARPVGGLGDLSYAVYLWHWPLIVLAPYVIGAPGALDRVGLLALTLLLAGVTKIAVEDPLRFAGRTANRRPAWTLGAAALATGAVICVPLAGAASLERQIRSGARAAQDLVAHPPPCLGAASRDPLQPRCRGVRARSAMVVPEPVVAREEPGSPCAGRRREGAVTVCSFGVPAGRAAATVALIGDSHAAHWRPALEVVARARRWHGVSITHTGCALSHAAKRAGTQRAQAACRAWNAAVPRWLARHPEVRLVVTSGITGGAVVPTGARSRFATEVAGYRDAWAALPPRVAHVLVLRDVPRMPGTTPGCVERAARDGRPPGPACAQPRERALAADAAVVAARHAGPQRARVIDLSDVLCTPARCEPVIGGVLVHKDGHHLTQLFATTLGPVLRPRVARALAAWGA